MAIKDNILQDALKSEIRPKKTTLYSRMKLLEPVDTNLLIDRQQSDNKPATNSKQTGNKTDNKAETNSKQTDNAKSGNFINWQQTGYTTDNKTDNKAETNWPQSDNKVATKTSFFSLVGLQRAILLAVYQVCKISRSHITDPLTLEFIAAQVKTDTKSAKTTLQRLEKKGGIIRVAFKNGRGGWTKYKIPDYLYNEILNLETVNKLATNWEQNGNKLATQPTTQPTTMASSSSNINNKNTTTNELITLSSEWEEIELGKLHKHNVRFGKEHIIQLFPYLKKHTAFDFQESIDAFVYDIEHGYVNQRKGLLNLFIGSIRNGTLYISSYYVSPYQQKLNDMVELAKQKSEQTFLTWVEENQETISKQLEAQSLSLAIDFRHRGKESLVWIKQHIFLKKI